MVWILSDVVEVRAEVDPGNQATMFPLGGFVYFCWPRPRDALGAQIAFRPSIIINPGVTPSTVESEKTITADISQLYV